MGWESVAERHAIRKSLRKLNLNVDSVVTPATENILCAVEAFSCHKSFVMNFQLYLFFILFYDVQILWMETQTFNNFVNENLLIGVTVNNERMGWNNRVEVKFMQSFQKVNTSSFSRQIEKFSSRSLLRRDVDFSSWEAAIFRLVYEKKLSISYLAVINFQ